MDFIRLEYRWEYYKKKNKKIKKHKNMESLKKKIIFIIIYADVFFCCFCCWCVHKIYWQAKKKNLFVQNIEKYIILKIKYIIGMLENE